MKEGYAVLIMTRKADGKICATETPSKSSAHAMVQATQIASLLFDHDYTQVTHMGAEFPSWYGENMYDEDVTVEIVTYVNH